MVPKFSDDRISGFLDGVLPAEEAAELRREIARDPELKQLVEELRQARGEVQALPRHRLGPDFTARVMAAVAQATPPEPIAAKPTPAVKVTAPSKPWKTFALGFLAASLVGVAVLVFTQPAKGPTVVDNDKNPPVVQPITSGTITLDELKVALAEAHQQPGQLFTARVTLKTADLKAGELDRLLAAQDMVISGANAHPEVAPSVAKAWEELSADKAAGLADSLATVREVYYVEAAPQAIDAAVAVLAKREELQLAEAVSRLPSSSGTLLAAANLGNPNQAEGEAVSNNAGKPAAGSAVRLGRKHIYKALGREDEHATATAADGMSDVLLMIRVK